MTNNIATADMLDAVTAIADHGATQSDRWLFIVLLALFIVAVAILGRWMANAYAKMLETWREDMKAMQAEIKQLNQTRVESSEKYAEALRKSEEDSGKNFREIMAQQSRDQQVAWQSLTSMLNAHAERLGALTHAIESLQTNCSGRRQIQ